VHQRRKHCLHAVRRHSSCEHKESTLECRHARLQSAPRAEHLAAAKTASAAQTPCPRALLRAALTAPRSCWRPARWRAAAARKARAPAEAKGTARRLTLTAAYAKKQRTTQPRSHRRGARQLLRSQQPASSAGDAPTGLAQPAAPAAAAGRTPSSHGRQAARAAAHEMVNVELAEQAREAPRSYWSNPPPLPLHTVRQANYTQSRRLGCSAQQTPLGDCERGSVLQEAVAHATQWPHLLGALALVRSERPLDLA